MVMNASGPISLGGIVTGQSINIEIGNAYNTIVSLNDTSVRALARQTTANSIIIAPTNFYNQYYYYLAPSSTTLPYTYNIISGQGGSDNGGSNSNPYNPIYWNYLAGGYRSGDIYYPTASPYNQVWNTNDTTSLTTLYNDLKTNYPNAFSNVTWISNTGSSQSFKATLNSGYHFYATNYTVGGPFSTQYGGGLTPVSQCFMNPGMEVTFSVTPTTSGVAVSNANGPASAYSLVGAGSSAMTILTNEGMLWQNTTGYGGSIDVVAGITVNGKSSNWRVTVDGVVVLQVVNPEGTYGPYTSNPMGPFTVQPNSCVLMEEWTWGAGASFTNSSIMTGGTFSVGYTVTHV